MNSLRYLTVAFLLAGAISAGAQTTLTVSDNDNSTTPAPGQPLPYTIQVKNTGSQDSGAVTVTDTYSTTKFLSVSWSQCANTAQCMPPSGGTATATINNLPAGSTATFTLQGTVPCGSSGSLVNSVSVSADNANTVMATDTDTITIPSGLPTASALSSNKNPAGPGQTVVFTATVTSFGSPVTSFTVQFLNGTSLISGCSAVPMNGTGQATCSASFATIGAQSITAKYSGGYNCGGANYAASTSSALNESIKGNTSTTASNASVAFSPVDQTVSLSAGVTSSGNTVNEGTVTFAIFNGATQIGSSVTSGTVTNNAASANYTVPAGTAQGIYSIHATYNAGTDFNTSSDNTHTLNIGPVIGDGGIIFNGPDAVVSAQVVMGHVYRLQRKLSLTDETEWQDIPGVNDLTATGTDIESITDPNALSLGTAFYQIIVVQ